MSAMGASRTEGRIEIERMPLNALTVHAILMSTLTMMREAVFQAKDRSVHPNVISELNALVGLIESARITLTDLYTSRRYGD